MDTRIKLCAVLPIAFVLLTIAACGGSGSGSESTDITPEDGPAGMPEPTARLLSLYPANDETVGRDVKPIITLSVTHATGINPTSGPSFLCNSRRVPFSQASSLSADGKVMTIMLSPQGGAILADECCTIGGDITPTSQGGGVSVPVSMAFCITQTSGWKTYTNSQYGFSLEYPDINARLKTVGGWTDSNEPKITSRTPFSYNECVLKGEDYGGGSKITIAGREYCLVEFSAKEPGPKGPTDPISSYSAEYVSRIGNEDVGIAFSVGWGVDGKQVGQEARALFEQILGTISIF